MANCFSLLSAVNNKRRVTWNSIRNNFDFVVALRSFFARISHFHRDLYIISTIRSSVLFYRAICGGWPQHQQNAIIMKFPKLFMKFSFNGQHNAMVHSIQFPANTGCYQFSRETDRQTRDGHNAGKGPVSNTAIIHTQSTGDPWPAIQNSRMKWENTQWLTDCDLLWHPSVRHWDQTGMQVLLERPCLVHNNAGHKQLKSVFTAAHLDL